MPLQPDLVYRDEHGRHLVWQTNPPWNGAYTFVAPTMDALPLPTDAPPPPQPLDPGDPPMFGDYFADAAIRRLGGFTGKQANVPPLDVAISSADDHPLLFEGSKVVLDAPDKNGKSALVADVAYALASGLPV